MIVQSFPKEKEIKGLLLSRKYTVHRSTVLLAIAAFPRVPRQLCGNA